MYLGRQRPTETTSSVLRSTHTGDGSTTTFNLPGPVANEISIIATINGVTQQDSAYTTNGSQIIFASAPANGDAIELRTISDVGLSYAPSTGSVTTGILADDAVTAGKIATGAVTSAKLASGAAVANIGTRAISVSQVPAGSVIQVVQGTTATVVSTSVTSPTDTGLTATITPTSASSKILVLVSQNGCDISNANAVNGITLTLVRGVTTINTFAVALGYSNTTLRKIQSASVAYLDSPNTTSSTTYKTQFSQWFSSQAAVSVNASGVTSTIILMEIAA